MKTLPKKEKYVTTREMLQRVLENQVSMMRWMDAPPSTFKHEIKDTEALLSRD